MECKYKNIKRYDGISYFLLFVFYSRNQTFWLMQLMENNKL